MHDITAEIFKHRSEKYEVVHDIRQADMLVLTGGEDIDPQIYGEKPLHCTHFNPSRDRRDIELYGYATTHDLFVLGICRGAQLVNCLNGGKLWQDVNGHGRTHEIVDLVTNERIQTSSVHHQMMRPSGAGEIIATCNLASRKQRDGYIWTSDAPDVSEPDVEVVWYPLSNSLCIQGHPEFGPSELESYNFRLIDRYYTQGKKAAAA